MKHYIYRLSASMLLFPHVALANAGHPHHAEHDIVSHILAHSELVLFALLIFFILILKIRSYDSV